MILEDFNVRIFISLDTQISSVSPYFGNAPSAQEHNIKIMLKQEVISYGLYEIEKKNE
jgi:hypothetical protein